MQDVYSLRARLFSSTKVSLGNISPFELNFIVLGGLPIFLPLVMCMGESMLGSTNPIAWYFWMNATISAPHVYSTYVRLARKIDEGKISEVCGLPTYLAIVFLLSVVAISGNLLQILTVINVWQSFHYVRQVYGVSRIYDRRLGSGNGNQIDSQATDPQARNKRARWWQDPSFLAYHLAMPLFVLGRWNMLFIAWNGKASEVIMPVRMPDSLMILCVVLAVLALLIGLNYEWQKFSSRPVYNPISLINLIVYFAIHMFGFLSITFYQRGFFAVTIFHAIQYLALVCWTEGRVTVQKGLSFATVCKFSPVLVAFLSFWLLIFIPSYIWQGNVIDALDRFWPHHLAGILLYAVSAHHYCIDTFLWRAKIGK
jgi:hypothetical protein